jgi:hypothetical protein
MVSAGCSAAFGCHGAVVCIRCAACDAALCSSLSSPQLGNSAHRRSHMCSNPAWHAMPPVAEPQLQVVSGDVLHRVAARHRLLYGCLGRQKLHVEGVDDVQGVDSSLKTQKSVYGHSEAPGCQPTAFAGLHGTRCWVYLPHASHGNTVSVGLLRHACLWISCNVRGDWSECCMPHASIFTCCMLSQVCANWGPPTVLFDCFSRFTHA